MPIRRSLAPPMTLTRGIAATIADVNPDLALTFRSLSDVVNASITPERILAIVLGFFGALALLLAALGLYGVTSYTVNRRRGEIGIRMALGASPDGVVRMVLSRVSLLVGTGVIIGVTASVWLSRFVAPLLYSLQPGDPKTEPGPGTSVPASESMQDGWYIDLPSANCWDRGDLAEPFGFTIAQRSNAPRDRVHIKRLGTARRGYPIEETSRSKDERGTSTSKVELIEFFDAPLDAALFTVPTGYRPALPNLFGGYDLTKPDTVMDRLQSYWHGLRAWADGRLRFVWRQ
jgi:hypothetical protein